MEKTEKANRRPISLRTIIDSILVLAIILFVLMFTFSILLSNSVHQVDVCKDQLLAIATGVQELDRTAVHLTQQTYLYIQHHDQAYMDSYFDTVAGQVEPVLNALRSQSKAPDNDKALTAAIDRFDFMLSLNVYAMRLSAAAHGIDEAQLAPSVSAVPLSEKDAALSPEQMAEKARLLVCGKEYSQAYSYFRSSLESFRANAAGNLELALQNAEDSVLSYKEKQFASMFVLLVLILLACVLLIKIVLRPLESCIQSIQKGQPFQVRGVYELQRMARSYNESYSHNIESQEKLRLRAERDPMTGLLNQGNFGVLKQRLENSATKLGLMVIDVDYFKHINDAYGHEVGNRTLKKIASLLENNVRPDDYVIRYGGDEFVVVMMNIAKENAGTVERKISQINEQLQQPEDGLPAVSLSVGASFSESGFHDTLFQQADEAMYEVKRKGRCGFASYQDIAPELHADENTPAKQNKPCILLVDDSEMNREILCSMLEDEYDVFQVFNGMQAIEEISKKGYNFTAVLLDLVMPVCDGYEVLSFMKKHRWHEILPVIVISSETDPSCISRAYDLGARDFISRPFDAQLVRHRVSNTIGLNLRYKRLSELVTRKIQEKIAGYNMMLSVLGQVVEFRNHESGSHVLHIGLITEMLLDCLMKKPNSYGLTYEEAQRICFASALHDIGKITIPDEIINKPGRLTPEEWSIMETHSIAGADLLDQIEGLEGDPVIHRAREICRWHHERYDGKGYPDGLVGEEIPISAQVVAVADVYDALTSDRCYKPAYTHEQAIHMILNGECGAFNPLLLECLTEIADQLPAKLRKDSGARKWNRDASNIVEEISHLGELDGSSKLMFQLQFEQACTDYFKQLVGGYFFTYRADTELLILSPALAKILNSDETVHTPSQNKSLLTRLSETEFSWSALRADASEQNPERTVEFSCGEGAQKQVYHCRVRTIWSGKETPQYLGMVGVLLPDE